MDSIEIQNFHISLEHPVDERGPLLHTIFMALLLCDCASNPMFISGEGVQVILPKWWGVWWIRVSVCHGSSREVRVGAEIEQTGKAELF